jgi:hypothetical protein
MVRGMATVGLGALVVLGCSSRGPGSGAAAPLGERAPAPTVVEKPRCSAPLGLDVVAAGGDASGSTVVMARVHGRLLAYVADEDESVVRVLDVDGSESPKEPPHELGSVKVAGRPGRMVMLPGGRLAVTLTDRAEVAVYTPAPLGDDGLDLRCTFATPDEPVDLAMTADHKTLLVVTDWAHTLVGFDSDTAERRFEVALPRSPRAIVASSDGAHAYVAHAAGGAMSVVDLRAASPVAGKVDLHGTEPPALTRFDFFSGVTWTVGDDDVAVVSRESQQEEGKVETSTEALSTRSACQGFALAEIAGPEPRVLAPIVEVATGDIAVPSSGYGSGGGFGAEVPAVAIIDEKTGKIVKDSVNISAASTESCLLPRAAAASGGSLFVACMGIDAVIEYEVAPTMARTQEFGTTPLDVERRRWPVGNGPTGIAVHGLRAVVWSQFAQTASVFTVGADAGIASPTTVTVSRRTRTEDEAQLSMGRTLFHTSADHRIAGDGRSCASCHPNGRDDGLVWSTPGGPRQTPMLAGRLPDTAPYGWDGAGSDLEHHLDHTLARLEGQGLPPLARASLVRYITTLPGPSEHATTPASALAEGHAVFLAAGCESCHAAEGGFTDGKSHEVGSRVRADKAAAFDTPSLRFVAGTAPYFHDGRYATLRDLLTRSDGPMGAARDRSAADIDALETFVRSL